MFDSNLAVTTFSIGFTHHTTILSKVKTQEERYFYIQLCHDRSLTVDEMNTFFLKKN